MELKPFLKSIASERLARLGVTFSFDFICLNNNNNNNNNNFNHNNNHNNNNNNRIKQYTQTEKLQQIGQI